MPHSHHSHSGQFCKHAVGTLEETVQKAVENGFEVYGLTEHVPRYRVDDLYPEEQGLSVEILQQQFESFLEEAKRLKKVYEKKICVLVGLETEFIGLRDLEGLDEILSRDLGHDQEKGEGEGRRIEYIVGSIHHVNGIPIDFDQDTYKKAVLSFGDIEDGGEDKGNLEVEVEVEAESELDSKNQNQTHKKQLENFLSAYFDSQYELLTRFKPEIIGHFDLCRLYTPHIRFETDYPKVWEKIKRNVRFGVEYGGLFELNGAAFRKGWETGYPGRDVAELILKLGGRFALSDDSHGPHAVGLNYDRVYQYLKSLNVEEIWYLQPSETVNSAGRKVKPALLENWKDHPFWKGKD